MPDPKHAAMALELAIMMTHDMDIENRIRICEDFRQRAANDATEVAIVAAASVMNKWGGPYDVDQDEVITAIRATKGSTT